MVGPVRIHSEEAPMTRELTLRRVGGSIGATLPKDMADRLNLQPGDRVLAVETEQGILLTPYDPNTERALAIAARVARRYRNALRELAK
jgi:putative addiction module antidote